tara:strand:+ start:1789 stop:2163 length:375 start_codon:yes stop_codon:yes gene_type:complete
MEVIIDLREMENYRILSKHSMRQQTLAQVELVKLCEQRKDPELTAIMHRYADAGRVIDFAHKVLCVNGRPVGNPVEHARYAEQYMNEISHRPRRRKPAAASKKRRCPNYLKLVHSSPAPKRLHA